MASANNSNSSKVKFNLEINGFLVKIANTEQEIRAAQRLRFEVFNLEMKEGLNTSWETGLDQDEYDEHADHLIVMDRKSCEVVGTYRMLRKTVAQSNGGFYSEGEFDMTNLKRLPHEILEMGRSCVHKDYRSNGVINLLWAGIARYMELSKAKYVFGCGSLHTHNVDEVSEIYSYLKSRYYSDEQYRVYPHQECSVPGLNENVPLNNTREIMKKIPPLLKGYFRMGAYVCGEPARDAEFGTTDFFILLPTAQMTKRYQNHYKTVLRNQK